MTCRTESNQTWVHTYNAENRLSVVEKVMGDCTTYGTTTDTWIYTYDGDGVRVKEVYKIGETEQYTKYYFAGGAYEVMDNYVPDPDETTVKRYYNIAGMMVAMHNGTNLVYFAQDHLSSTSIVMDTNGEPLSQNRYMPFGEVRNISGVTNITQTNFGYTGQRNIADIGLMDYDARFYSPTLMRFIQPDTIVPNPQKPQSFNRYSYVLNNPLIYIDPTGRKSICLDGERCFNIDPGSFTYNYLPDPRKDYKGKDPVKKDVDAGGGDSSGGGDSGGGGESDNTPSLTTGTKTCYYYRRGAAPFNGWNETPCWQGQYLPETYSMYEGHWIPLVDTMIDILGGVVDGGTLLSLVLTGGSGVLATMPIQVAMGVTEIVWGGYLYSEGWDDEAVENVIEFLGSNALDLGLESVTKAGRAIPVFGFVISLHSLQQNIDTIKKGMVEHPQWIELWDGLPPSNPSYPDMK